MGDGLPRKQAVRANAAEATAALWKSVFYVAFCLPGAILLWFQYYFPKPGQIHASARRFRNRGMEVLYTLVIYGFLLFFLWPAFLPNKVTSNSIAGAPSSLRTEGGRPYDSESKPSSKNSTTQESPNPSAQSPRQSSIVHTQPQPSPID